MPAKDEEYVSICVRVKKSTVDKVNAKLAGYLHPPEQDPETRVITQRPVYPNLIRSWIGQTVGHSIGALVGAEDEEILELERQAQALRAQAQKKFEPEVQLEQAVPAEEAKS